MRHFVRSIPFALFALLFAPATVRAQGTEEPPEEAVESDGEPMEGEEAEFEMPAKIELPGLKWTDGPAQFPVGSMASIDVPEGFRVTDARGTRVFNEFNGNPSGPSELATLLPADLTDYWFVTFDWNDSGYVSDAEKDDLDADAILETIRQGNDEGNKYRRSRGQPILTVTGWERKPVYNQATHNVEWCIRAECEGQPIVNFNVRILGRAGVMSANLVVAPASLSKVLPTFQKLLTGFSYTKGHTYGEYKKGDKLAEYGLKGLIAGGAVAVALKTGLLQKFWKFILIGLVAIGGFIKKLFGGKGGGERPRRGPRGDAPGSAQ